MPFKASQMHLSFILPCCDTTTSFIERPKRKTNSYTKIFFLENTISWKKWMSETRNRLWTFFSEALVSPNQKVRFIFCRLVGCKKKNMKLIFLFDAHSLRLSVRTLANTRTFACTQFHSHTHFWTHPLAFCTHTHFWRTHARQPRKY